MRKPYRRKTEQWAEQLASKFVHEQMGWDELFFEIMDDLWRLNHNHTNKVMYCKALARAFEAWGVET